MFIFLIYFLEIIHGVTTIVPNSEHENYAIHVYTNWYKLPKGEAMKLLFWNTVKAYNETNLKQAVGDLKLVSSKVAEDFFA